MMLNVKLGLEQMMFKDFFHWACTVSELRFWKSHPAATQRARLMMWSVKIYDFLPCMFGGWTSVLAFFYVHQGGFWPIPRCRYWWFLLPGYTGYVQSTIEAQGTMAQTCPRTCTGLAAMAAGTFVCSPRTGATGFRPAPLVFCASFLVKLVLVDSRYLFSVHSYL